MRRRVVRWCTLVGGSQEGVATTTSNSSGDGVVGTSCAAEGWTSGATRGGIVIISAFVDAVRDADVAVVGCCCQLLVPATAAIERSR
jgi:hypothetical protein